jgi:hypothetical protein
MHMVSTFLFLLAALSSATGAPMEPTSVCPPDDATSREMVQRFLTRPSWQSDRDSVGLVAPVSASQIRLLTDATDATVCQRIIETVGPPNWKPGWVWTAYQVNGLYFVAKRHVRDGSHWMGFAPLFILDANFRVIRGAAL